jgi:gamma-glutamylcyclotransferase (GGCT)/AIG2-like uncharacterized protein YtfP
MTKTFPIDRTLVAVYGSLKRGFYNHRLLEASTFMATGLVDGFEMFSLGSYPMVIPGNGKISVEVFEVDFPTFGQLDRLEGFPSFYGRQVVTVETPHCPIETWMYVGMPQQVKRCKRIRSGVWTLEEPVRLHS